MTGEIVSIKKIDCKDNFVYNLEVDSPEEMNKNYFADNLLVSNCHRLSTAAADSLLKLLEEPPENVRFILCTTDAHKLRPALLSRCQKHDFLKIYWLQISEQLELIMKQENIDCDKSALNLCARLAKGSMRNGIQNLQKALDNREGEDSLTIETVQKAFGTPDETLYAALLDEIIGTKDGKPDASEGYRIIHKILTSGAEFDMVYENIADHLRNLIILGTCSAYKEFIYVSDENKKKLISQIKKISEGKKLAAITESLDILDEIKRSVEINLPPEHALLKWLVKSIFIFRK